MTRLADVVHGRNNSFHLLRLFAAAAVLLSHAFPLGTGDKNTEPWRAMFGVTPGSVAVDLFFAISGLLVTISLVRRNSAADFIRARFFRIWPALTLAIVLTVLVLGPAFTTWPIGAYFTDRLTVRHLAQNLVLLHGIVYKLPGVFASNPWPDAVNGSLWTLPSEVRCYIYLLASWWCLQRIGAGDRFRGLVALVWVALLAWHLQALRAGTIEDSPGRLYFMFCTGSGLYLFRDAVSLSWRWLAAGVAILAVSTAWMPLFGVVYTLLIPYAMLCVAYLPTGAILKFNRLGDYSYGTYIYAFPVQQSLMALFPAQGVAALFFGSLVITLILATASWHFVEQPAMKLARRRPPAPPPQPAAADMPSS